MTKDHVCVCGVCECVCTMYMQHAWGQTLLIQASSQRLPGWAQLDMMLGFKVTWKMPVEKETVAGELFQRPDCTNE